jgi:hypothetical protein
VVLAGGAFAAEEILALEIAATLLATLDLEEDRGPF